MNQGIELKVGDIIRVRQDEADKWVTGIVRLASPIGLSQSIALEISDVLKTPTGAYYGGVVPFLVDNEAGRFLDLQDNEYDVDLMMPKQKG